MEGLNSDNSSRLNFISRSSGGRTHVLKLAAPNRNITEGRLVFIITHHYLAPPFPALHIPRGSSLSSISHLSVGQQDGGGWGRTGEGGGEADSAVLLFPPPRGAEEEPRLTFLRGGRHLSQPLITWAGHRGQRSGKAPP